MPERNYQTEGYRYGFNGKENDNDVKGLGNQQDYGMRIYDARISRFLSSDPITHKYPELTPYQFASNSPISGNDFDGLEYVTAVYTLTIKNQQIKLNAKYIWYDNQAHNVHGPLGKGVNYHIKINNLDKGTVTKNNYFVSRGGFLSALTQYGNYMGSAPLPNFDAISGNIIEGSYRYDVEAVDFVDQQAKLHDQGYDRVKAVGATGLFTDWSTTPYDEAAEKAWINFAASHKEGDKDPFNGQQVTNDELRAARRGYRLFSPIVDAKKTAISHFMSSNYKEAKHGSKFLWGKTSFSKKDIASNYKLFLEKYMQKDKDGNWVRNESMWNKDADGNFTTPKTTSQQTQNN